MTEQNDKPGTVTLNGGRIDPNINPIKEEYDHVDVLDNGWVMCRNGTHGQDAEVTYYPAHQVEKIDRDTDQ